MQFLFNDVNGSDALVDDDEDNVGLDEEI